jgi:predicted SAM-dependent methyltransferase
MIGNHKKMLKKMIDTSRLLPNQPLRVIIGAGDQQWPGWIATQKGQLDLLNPDDWQDSFHSRWVDAFLCEHVWEHLTESEGRTAAALCLRWLRPGGYLRVAVPDGNFPDPEYQLLARVGWPGPKNHPAEDHKTLYDDQSFSNIFTNAGFNVDLLEYCDDQGRFNYHQWSVDDGPIYRSLLLDHRNQGGSVRSVSLILDAKKPA